MYVKVDSYWQNSPDYFVGPVSKAEAQAMIMAAQRANGSLVALSSQMSRDVRHGIRVVIVTNRAAKSRIIEDYPNRNILPSIPTSTDELKEMVDEIHELA